MKIELKHLVYQIHKPLNVVFSDTNEVDIITQIDFENGIVSFLNRKENYLLSSGIFKLALHPLSDLAKEIEVNGEKIILLNNIFSCINSTRCYNNAVKDIKQGKFYFISNYFKLLEYHFDVFGLIEKGLAVDINNC